MRATIYAAAAVWAAVVVSACGDDARVTSDAGDDGGGEDDADMPHTCGGYLPFTSYYEPQRRITVSSSTIPGDYPTLEAAAAAATPGTEIHLQPGTHEPDQFIANLRGAADAPIWITGAANGWQGGAPMATFSGGAQAFQLQRPTYVLIRDIIVENATSNGINIDDGGDFDDPMAAHHIFLMNIDVHDVGTAGGNNDCLKVSGLNDLWVVGSSFASCGGGGSGIDHVGVHRSYIANNTFDARMENAVQSKGGSTDHDIVGNSVRITGPRAFNMGGSTDLDLFRPSLSTTAPNAEARRIYVYDNVIWNLGPQATPFAFVGCVDCIASNNAARDHQRWHLRILQETPTDSAPYTFEPTKNGIVANNIFEFTSTDLATAVNIGADTDAASFQFFNNLWYALDDAAESAPTLPSPEMNGVVGEPSGARWTDTLGDPYPYCEVPQAVNGRGKQIGLGSHQDGCPDANAIGPFQICVDP